MSGVSGVSAATGMNGTAPVPGRAQRPASAPSGKAGRWGRGLFAVAVSAVALVVAQQSLVVMRADWQSSVARGRIEQWMKGKLEWDEPQWQRTVTDLQDALALTPRDATLHDAMAQLYAARANQVWTTGDAGTPEIALYGKALESQLESLRLRPTHAVSWANLALIHFGLNSTPDETFAAWRKARALGPYEAEVQQLLLTVASEAWAAAPADVQQWAEQQRPGLTRQMAQKALQEAEAAAAAAQPGLTTDGLAAGAAPAASASATATPAR